jgi:hypothetical protein
MRARMLGLLSVSIGTGPLGFLQVGLLAEAMGAQLAIVTTSAEGMIALVLTRRFCSRSETVLDRWQFNRTKIKWWVNWWVVPPSGRNHFVFQRHLADTPSARPPVS